MSSKSGTLYEEINPIYDGFYYIAYHKEQNKAFGNRLFCHKLTKEFEPVLDADNKPVKVLKLASKLKHIGYVD